jgi:predicted regulator of Ras-like GTPase activity (Roadblock/LC7/MglB family)
VSSEAGQFFNALRDRLPGIRALILLSPSGELLEYASNSPGFDASAFASEHATLLRIAQHTLQDMGLGVLQEQVLISSGSLILVRRLSGNRFAVAVCAPDIHLGRLRYELKRCLLYSTPSNL